jgi:aspartate/methionine/tyrosine aminotransferase
MFIDERLANTEFPLPAIRQVNMAKHPSAVSLGLGELKDFPVDEKILLAMEKAMRADGTNYSGNAGLPALRNAIAKNQQLADGFMYEPEHVVVTIGVQNALYAAIKTLAKLGAKRVLIPEINFGIYQKIPADFGLEVLTYKLNPDFGINSQALESMVMPDDLLIINSPSNPTGRVFTESEQDALAKVLQQKLTQGYVISDEIYNTLVYDGEPAVSFAHFFERTIVLNGISKSAAAAGLRVGWIVTRNKILAQAFTSTNATVISCPPTLNQYAAIPAVLGETNKSIENYNQILKQNRQIVAQHLSLANIPFVLPTGSFYFFPKIDSLLAMGVKDFCMMLAQKENGVVVIPGEAFGAPNYIRISLASSQIEEGMKRLVSFLKH